MEKGTKILILASLLMIFIIFPLVSALEVECTPSGNQCNSNEYCFNYECIKTGTGGALEDEEKGNQIRTPENTFQNNLTNFSALIIALGIIVGLTILGLLIRKRNR